MEKYCQVLTKLITREQLARDNYYYYLKKKYNCYDDDIIVDLITDKENEIREQLERKAVKSLYR